MRFVPVSRALGADPGRSTRVSDRGTKTRGLRGGVV